MRPANLSPGTTLLVLICGGAVLSISLGVRQSFGLFSAPIMNDLGWSMSLLAMALGLQNFVWGLTQPFFGAMADRFGASRVVMVGAVLYAAGLLMMAWGQDPVLYQIGGAGLVGCGVSATAFPIVLGAVARVVPAERRSWYLGLASAGGSFGQAIFAPIGGQLIAELGWSPAFVVMAAVAATMALFALALVPADRLLPSRRRTGPAAPLAAADQSLRDALREAMRYPGFLLLTAGFFVCGYQVVFIAVHLPAFVTSNDLPDWVGAWGLALIGLFNIAGTLLAGALGMRYRMKSLLSLIYLLRAVAISVFLLVPYTEVSVLVFAGTMGLLWLSTVPLTTGLIGLMFGPRHSGMLFGIVFFSHQVGSFLGAWSGGYIFDLTGSFQLVWYISIALGIFAAIVHWPIRERPVDRLAAQAV